MNIYKVEIIETPEKTVSVTADTAAEALASAKREYHECSDGYVLDADNFVAVEFNVKAESQSRHFTDGYFRMMEDIIRGYEAAKKERRAAKAALEAAGDWKGVEDWNACEKAFKFPFSKGAMVAFRSWQETKSNRSDCFEVTSLPWASEVFDFLMTLKEAGLSRIVITDQSTALMEIIHTMVAERCTLVGTATVTRSLERWGEHITTKVDGLEIKL